jgi:hypothetical protein
MNVGVTETGCVSLPEGSVMKFSYAELINYVTYSNSYTFVLVIIALRSHFSNGFTYLKQLGTISIKKNCLLFLAGRLGS